MLKLFWDCCWLEVPSFKGEVLFVDPLAEGLYEYGLLVSMGLSWLDDFTLEETGCVLEFVRLLLRGLFSGTGRESEEILFGLFSSCFQNCGIVSMEWS